MRLVGRFTRRARGRCQQGMFRRRRPLPSAFYGEVDEIGKALEAARAPDPRRAVCGGGENPLAIGTEVDGGHGIGGAGQDEGSLLGDAALPQLGALEVPQPDLPILPPCEKAGAVWADTRVLEPPVTRHEE